MNSFPFQNDPFFSDHGFPSHFGQLSLGNGQGREGAGAVGRTGRGADFGAGRMDIDSSFRNMRQFMDEMSQGMQLQRSVDGGNGHSYVQSSVYSYSRNDQGQPEIYEAHHSDRRAPGGVREEKKALRDSKKQFEKMAVGRHIGERGHVIERHRNTDTNELSQHQNLIGLREEDVSGYEREWQDKTRDWSRTNFTNGREFSLGGGARRGLEGRQEYGGHNGRRAALDYNNNSKPHRSNRRH